MGVDPWQVHHRCGIFLQSVATSKARKKPSAPFLCLPWFSFKRFGKGLRLSGFCLEAWDHRFQAYRKVAKCYQLKSGILYTEGT